MLQELAWSRPHPATPPRQCTHIPAARRPSRRLPGPRKLTPVSSLGTAIARELLPAVTVAPAAVRAAAAATAAMGAERAAAQCVASISSILVTRTTYARHWASVIASQGASPLHVPNTKNPLTCDLERW